MKLKDYEKPTKLIKKAIEDGIETTYEYSIWLIGYISGTRNEEKKCLEMVMNRENIKKWHKELEDDDFEPFPSFAEESIRLHEEKQEAKQ